MPNRGPEAIDHSVELEEIADVRVRRPRSSRSPGSVLVVLAALGVAAALILFRGRIQAGESTAPPAVASTEATVTPTAAADAPGDIATPAPSAPQPSIAPGAFRAVRVDGLDADVSIRQIWPLYDWVDGDRLLAVADRPLGGGEVESVFLLSPDGERWTVIDGPTPGFDLRAGALEANQVIVIGRAPGDAGPVWQDWTVTSGGAWFEGPATNPGTPLIGLDDVLDVRFMIRNSVGRALAVVSVPSGDGATTVDAIRISEKGVRWEPVPDFLGDATVFGVVANYTHVIVLTNERVADGRTRIRTWTSEDRVSWEAHDIATINGAATGMTGPEPWYGTAVMPIVVVGTERAGGASAPRAWTSTDGMTWAASDITTAAGAAPAGVSAVAAGQMGIVNVEPMRRNFIAIAEDGSSAWTSLDTATWQPLRFLPADAVGELSAIAVLGTVVVAGGADLDGPVLWVGNAFDRGVPSLSSA